MSMTTKRPARAEARHWRATFAALVAVLSIGSTGCASDVTEEDDDVLGEETGETADELANLEYKETNTISVFGCSVPSHGTSWGHACYVTSPADMIEVADGASDGRSVGAHWIVRDRSGRIQRRGICRFTGGSGRYGACSYVFTTGYRLSMRMGRCDGNTANCRSIDGYRDWTGWETGRIY
jgi:hypothetical protein